MDAAIESKLFGMTTDATNLLLSCWKHDILVTSYSLLCEVRRCIIKERAEGTQLIAYL